MSRHEAVIEASCVGRAEANYKQLARDCPEDALDRYILMLCDRPILPHHVTELRRRSKARAGALPAPR